MSFVIQSDPQFVQLDVIINQLLEQAGGSFSACSPARVNQVRKVPSLIPKTLFLLGKWRNHPGF
jgi:hypothetical protein